MSTAFSEPLKTLPYAVLHNSMLSAIKLMPVSTLELRRTQAPLVLNSDVYRTLLKCEIYVQRAVSACRGECATYGEKS